MQVVRKDAGQSRHVLSVVKVVLHLPPEECRTPTARPLAVPPLQNRTSAGRVFGRTDAGAGHQASRTQGFSFGMLGDDPGQGPSLNLAKALTTLVTSAGETCSL